tara:strand:- start:54 stop:221 length:168 start_codon:yes stop_codon:yes gene_type:complete
MKAEEYVHKITDLYDNSGDEAAAVKLLKQYALNLFEQYLDGEKTIAEISQELKQE